MTKIEAISFESKFEALWDDFVINDSRNGGLFHERRFLSYHPADRFNDESVLFYSGGKLLAVLPSARCRTDDGRLAAISHPGSTVGGIVYDKRATLRDVLHIVEAAIDFFRRRNYTSIELRLGEPLTSYHADGELSYLLWHRGFSMVSRYASPCVNLEKESNWVDLGRKKNLGSIRQSMSRDVDVSMIDDPRMPYALVSENLASRYDARPTHSLEELQDLKQRYPQRIHFWLATLAHRPIATTVTFVVNDDLIHDFYIGQDYEYRKLNVMPHVFYTAFEYYRSNGFKWFNFGRTTNRDKINWGIMEFKERLGGRCAFKEVWILEDLDMYRPYGDTEAVIG